MLETAYHELHALEDTHWWYVGARAAYRALLDTGLGGPGGGFRLLEVGSGSGGNLPLLEAYGPTAGLEISATALRLTPQPPALGLVQGSAVELPFPDNYFDAVALFGVIEHLEDDGQALREAWRVCRPGGCVALLTSAAPILWSHHDEANLHQRRYTRAGLAAVLTQAGLAPLKLTHQNFFTFFPTLAVRLWQRRRPQAPRYDMSAPPAWLNTALASVLRFEAWWIRSSSFPIGVDLLAVCRPLKDTRHV